MKTLLKIDSSFNSKNSFSRNSSNYFTELWKKNNPDGLITNRDLEKIDIPHLTEEAYNLFFDTDYKGDKLYYSDLLIEELLEADEIVISCPVYNHSVPSKLKVYIDHIVRINKTFQYDSRTFERRGLLEGKIATIIVARGGAFSETDGDGVENYLSGILNYMGINNIKKYSISETAFENSAEQLETAKTGIKKFFSNLNSL